MFTLPQSSNPGSTSDSSLKMTESGGELRAVLQYIFPVRKFQPVASIKEAAQLIETAQKLELTLVEKMIKLQLSQLLQKERNYVMVWAYSKHFGLEHERKRSLLNILAADDDELQSMTNSTSVRSWLHRLSALEYADMLAWRKMGIVEAQIALQSLQIKQCPNHPFTLIPHFLSSSTHSCNPFKFLISPAPLLAYLLRGSVLTKKATGYCYNCQFSTSLAGIIDAIESTKASLQTEAPYISTSDTSDVESEGASASLELYVGALEGLDPTLWPDEQQMNDLFQQFDDARNCAKISEVS